MSKSFNEEIYNALVCICETCVDESKLHISSQEAVEEIRHYLDFMNDDRFDEKFEFGFEKEVKQLQQENEQLKVQIEQLKEYQKFVDSQSLADHDKETRKEVCDEIREFILKARKDNQFDFSVYHKGIDMAYLNINDFLDKIEKGE